MATFEVDFSIVGRFSARVEADSLKEAKMFVRTETMAVLGNHEALNADIEAVDVTSIREY